VGLERDRRHPHREGHEDAIALVRRPGGAALEGRPRSEPGRRLTLRPELDEGRRVLLLGDQQMAILHERRALALRALGVDPRVMERVPVRYLGGDPGDDPGAGPGEQLDPWARLLGADGPRGD